jgi:hypothetical protein
MIELIWLLALFGVAFSLKETSGPFGVMSFIRRKLFSNKFVGVYFFQMFDCYFCLSFNLAVIYGMAMGFGWQQMLTWAFAGATSSLIIGRILK